MIKWIGTDTSRFVKWNEEAETYFELLFKLIERGLVHDYLDLEGDTFHELLNYSKELEELNKNKNEVAFRSLKSRCSFFILFLNNLNRLEDT